MARKDWADLSPEYRRRLIRAGIGPFTSSREAAGARQRARGHKPQEHKARATAPGKFTLSATDRAFLQRQRERAPKGSDFSKAEKYYRNLSPERREQVRERQRREAAEYRQRHREKRRSFDDFLDDWEDEEPEFDADDKILFFYH